MAVLPTVGGDVGAWGTKLNNWLLVGHNADGTTIGGGGYTLIQDSVLGTAGTFDFTSISGSYKHLKLIVAARLNAAVSEDAITLILNNDSGNNYNWQYNYWNNVAGNSGARVTTGSSFRYGEAPGSTTPSGYVGSFEILFPDYAGTTFYKTMSAIGGRIGSNNMVQQNHGHWLSTSAITRITLNETFATGSRASLYGF